MIEKTTIFALSSGRPPAAIALVRVSGPRAGEALRKIAGVLPPPRRARLAELKTASGEVIDRALVLWFPAPKSETGEDVAEFHIHGGRAVLSLLINALEAIDGLRAAERGEFTRRALENGKIDLVAAEGLSDLIDAETEAQRRQAQRQLHGLLGPAAEDWRARAIAIVAAIEAGLDFSDEGDVEETVAAQAIPAIVTLREDIDRVLAASRHGERLRDGLVVAIAGPPNVGKSTLLNRLARREAAIVSPHAGTTRDVIEVHLDLAGYPVTLLDTAGIHASDDPVEREGVRRALQRASEADLVLWLRDAAGGNGLEGEEPGATARAGQGVPTWIVWNKIDMAHADASLVGDEGPPGEFLQFRISARDGTGLILLIEQLTAFADGYFGCGESAMISRTRHRGLLEEASAALGRSIQTFELGEEIAAEELRMAIRSLGRLLGKVDVEDVLDAIFAEFCIGK